MSVVSLQMETPRCLRELRLFDAAEDEDDDARTPMEMEMLSAA
jgi:hypothetical protein